MIAFGPILRSLLVQPTHGSTQMIRAMLVWDTTALPERFLQTFGERLKGFTETKTGCLGVGVGEHQMIDHMRKWCSRNSDPKILHMGKVGLGTFAGRVLLFKHDLSFWSMQRAPMSNMTLSGSHLCRLIALRVTLTQEREQR